MDKEIPQKCIYELCLTSNFSSGWGIISQSIDSLELYSVFGECVCRYTFLLTSTLTFDPSTLRVNHLQIPSRVTPPSEFGENASLSYFVHTRTSRGENNKKKHLFFSYYSRLHLFMYCWNPTSTGARISWNKILPLFNHHFYLGFLRGRVKRNKNLCWALISRVSMIEVNNDIHSDIPAPAEVHSSCGGVWGCVCVCVEGGGGGGKHKGLILFLPHTLQTFIKQASEQWLPLFHTVVSGSTGHSSVHRRLHKVSTVWSYCTVKSPPPTPTPTHI